MTQQKVQRDQFASSALPDLTDTLISSPATGEVLTYNAGAWENLPPVSRPSAPAQNTQVLQMSSIGLLGVGDINYNWFVASLPDPVYVQPQYIVYDSINQNFVITQESGLFEVVISARINANTWPSNAKSNYGSQLSPAGVGAYVLGETASRRYQETSLVASGTSDTPNLTTFVDRYLISGIPTNRFVIGTFLSSYGATGTIVDYRCTVTVHKLGPAFVFS
jgi:hypothetical protein